VTSGAANIWECRSIPIQQLHNMGSLLVPAAAITEITLILGGQPKIFGLTTEPTAMAGIRDAGQHSDREMNLKPRLTHQKLRRHGHRRLSPQKIERD
jgi:hypothetical protein